MVHCSLGNYHHFQSETPRFNVSNVIFAMNGSLNYYENIEKYVLRCTTIGFKQKYGHKSSRRADMNLQCRSEFPAEIGPRYFVGCRSWDCVIWHHYFSYLYIKHHSLQRYLIETSNRRCSCIIIVDESQVIAQSVKLEQCTSTMWYGFTMTGQRGKLYEKIFFTFDFHILPWRRHIGARIIGLR